MAYFSLSEICPEIFISGLLLSERIQRPRGIHISKGSVEPVDTGCPELFGPGKCLLLACQVSGKMQAGR